MREGFRKDFEMQEEPAVLETGLARKALRGTMQKILELRGVPGENNITA